MSIINQSSISYKENLISVIVPVYNVEKYLQRCVDSILSQTYSNLEVILVDDGSPDNCGIICDEYAKRDKRIKVIHKKNGGLSDARNSGLSIAMGDYISFIDSDDYIADDYYEHLEKLLNSYNADIAQCEFHRVYEDKEFDLNNNNDERVVCWSNIQALENYFNGYYVNMVVACNKLYKKHLFNEVRFPFGKVNEDEFTTHKIIYKSKRLVHTDRKMYFYFQRSNSIMGVGFNIKKLDYLEALEERIKFFVENGQEKLYLNAEATYCNILRRFYEKVYYSSIVSKEKHLKMIIKKFSENFHLFMKNQSIPMHIKPLLIIFHISPTVGIFFDMLIYKLRNNKF